MGKLHLHLDWYRMWRSTVELTSPINSPQLPSIRLLPSYSEIQHSRSLLGSEIQEPLRSLMVGQPSVDTLGEGSGLNTKDYLSVTRVDKDSVAFRNNDNRVYHSRRTRPPLPSPPISSILRSTLTTSFTARDHPEQHNARVEAITSRLGSLTASDLAAESSNTHNRLEEEQPTMNQEQGRHT
ncbi:hypothetical protein BDQ17DRAFT_462481 [Cyathus striatus]|nr:hypothetical protein BDQ17DRAFT_462481 [Cyathus striatus]